MSAFSQEDLLRVRNQHEDWLRAQPGFVGSGVGLSGGGEISLKIYSDRMPADTRNAVLDRLKGVPVVIEETGRPRLQSSD
jgi:hypothetical protein